MADPSKVFIGVVKAFNSERGWGHIDCEETRLIYSKDMFLLRSQLNGINVSQGDQVSFTVREGRRGPEAANVKVLHSASGGQGLQVSMSDLPEGQGQSSAEQLALAETNRSRPSRWGEGAPAGEEEERSSGESTSNSTLAVPATQTGKVYSGTLKAFHEDKGWGHISCEVTRQIYNRDMFVMRSALRGARIVAGDEVRFTVKQGQKGPEAVDVWPLSPSKMGLCSTEMTGREFYGTLKMFNAAKGWGFVQCEETKQLYGKDIFVHKREFPNGCSLSDDNTVRFTVEMGKDGRPEARQVVPCPAGSLPGSWEANHYGGCAGCSGCGGCGGCAGYGCGGCGGCGCVGGCRGVGGGYGEWPGGYCRGGCCGGRGMPPAGCYSDHGGYSMGGPCCGAMPHAVGPAAWGPCGAPPGPYGAGFAVPVPPPPGGWKWHALPPGMAVPKPEGPFLGHFGLGLPLPHGAMDSRLDNRFAPY